MVSWWRMAFIFGPAIARGDISSFGLYTPFIFGHLLGRVVKNWKSKVKLRGWPHKIPDDLMWNWRKRTGREIFFVVAFLAGCKFLNAETRSLFNFFLSSFVCPMLRFWFPQRNKGPLYKGSPLWDTTFGNTSVHVLMIVGLIASWAFQGIDHLFLGFLFLQAIPELQRRFWMKPVQHLYLVIGILIVCFPFFSIGLMAWYLPSYLEMLPKPYLQVLCKVANAKPSIPDHYATLGVSPDADMKMIKKIFREQAIELHPDKVGDDPEKLARFHAIQTASDALTKGRADYDKSIENQELNEMVPRCYAFLVMMGYWLLHSLIDWNDVEGMRDQHKDALRLHVMRGGDVDLRSIGLTDDDKGKETLKEYCEPEDIELPFITGKKDDIIEMRSLLQQSGYHLAPFPQVTGKLEQLQQEVVLGSRDHKCIRELNTTANFYVGCELEVEYHKEGEDRKTVVTTIVAYEGGDKRIATIQPPIGVNPFVVKASFTLRKAGLKDVKGDFGLHPFSSMHQVFQLGTPDQNKDFDWDLRNEDGYYNGFRFEVYNGATKVGDSLIYYWWPQQKKIVLETPLQIHQGKVLKGGVLRDADIKPELGTSTYTIYPESLIPRPRRRFVEGGTSGPTQQVSVSTSTLTHKNIVGAPKGSVAATKNYKAKVSKHKAYVKKSKGSGCCVM